MSNAVAAPTPDSVESCLDRGTEDYLDWVENHQPRPQGSPCFGRRVFGIAFSLTAAAVAVLLVVRF